MSVIQLLRDVVAQGIELEADGDRLKFHPQSAMTSDLAARLTANKPAVLAILTAPDVHLAMAWHAAVDRIAENHDFPSQAVDACRVASVEYGEPETHEFTCNRCGHHRYRDTSIHDGQSARRDCTGCGMTSGFPIWWGQQ